MLFVYHPKILHKYFFQFLLGVKMARRESENNAYAKFLRDKQRILWYVMFFSGVVNTDTSKFLQDSQQPRPQGAFPWLWGRGAVTAFWASPRFGHPHSHIPSVLGIPFSYYCSVLGISRYPPGMPKSLAFWTSPPKQFGISRENRKPFRDGCR